MILCSTLGESNISPKFFVRRGGGCGVGKEKTDEMLIVAGYFIVSGTHLPRIRCKKMAKERAEQVIILGLSYETETG